MKQTVIYNGTEFRAFNKSYAVSKSGNVLKLRGLQIVEPYFHPLGYLQISHADLVHRMVATCWLDRPEGANHVHHKNRDKTDNRAVNLEWVTPKTHMGERHRGEFAPYERTESVREKLRRYRTGRKHEPETIEKIRKASIALGCKPPPRPVGFKCSDQSRALMRENSPNGTRCMVDGVQYRSFSDAGEKLGIKSHTVRKRCLSNNFENYTVLDDPSLG